VSIRAIAWSYHQRNTNSTKEKKRGKKKEKEKKVRELKEGGQRLQDRIFASPDKGGHERENIGSDKRRISSLSLYGWGEEVRPVPQSDGLKGFQQTSY